MKLVIPVKYDQKKLKSVKNAKLINTYMTINLVVLMKNITYNYSNTCPKENKNPKYTLIFLAVNCGCLSSSHFSNFICWFQELNCWLDIHPGC